MRDKMAGNQEIFIIGLDGNLWLAEGPFGNVPPKRVPVDVKCDGWIWFDLGV
jgi:hypothetical protein